METDRFIVRQSVYGAIDNTPWMDTTNMTDIILQYLHFCSDHETMYCPEEDGCIHCYREEMDSIRQDYYDGLMCSEDEEDVEDN